MAYEYTTTKKIEFSETDMAGLVHFSNYFRYMEVAERDFFESLGLSNSIGAERFSRLSKSSSGM